MIEKTLEERRDERIEKARADLRHIRNCQRYTIARCRKSGIVPGWSWHASGRRPPLPFYDGDSEPGRCRICGQPTGSRVTWDPKCVTTYTLWTKPGTYALPLAVGQDGLCAITREPIGPPAREYLIDFEIDHEIPIYRVRRDFADRPWFDLLRYWGLSNLRGITRAAHVAKSAVEARERAGRRSVVPAQEIML